MELEYRIIWADDGHGNECPGNWTPVEWVFDHQRKAENNRGKPLSGLGMIHVEQALRVEFRDGNRV
jgi:hypothetical protein